MARAVSQLSPKAQRAYRDNPGLAAKRQQQVIAESVNSPAGRAETARLKAQDAKTAPPPPSASSTAAPAATPASSVAMPDLGGLGSSLLEKPLLILGALIIGFALYGRVVKPLGVSLSSQGATSGNAAVQSYLDQQNRKVALVSDTMPGRIVRANPAKVSA